MVRRLDCGERRKQMKKELMDKVLKQITEDVMNGDTTAIEELIADIPDDKAQGFLPEEENQSIEIDDISHINE
jgi:hypothetical protein